MLSLALVALADIIVWSSVSFLMACFQILCLDLHPALHQGNLSIPSVDGTWRKFWRCEEVGSESKLDGFCMVLWVVRPFGYHLVSGNPTHRPSTLGGLLGGAWGATWTKHLHGIHGDESLPSGGMVRHVLIRPCRSLFGFIKSQWSCHVHWNQVFEGITMGNNDSLAIDAVGLSSFVVNYCTAHIQNTMVQFSCCAFLGSSKTPSESMSGMSVGNLKCNLLGDHGYSSPPVFGRMYWVALHIDHIWPYNIMALPKIRPKPTLIHFVAQKPQFWIMFQSEVV